MQESWERNKNKNIANIHTHTPSNSHNTFIYVVEILRAYDGIFVSPNSKYVYFGGTYNIILPIYMRHRNTQRITSHAKPCKPSRQVEKLKSWNKSETCHCHIHPLLSMLQCAMFLFLSGIRHCVRQILSNSHSSNAKGPKMTTEKNLIVWNDLNCEYVRLNKIKGNTEFK